MSAWAVHLEFVEDGSSKFWRARVDGSTLVVNYGRIGTNGQTQIKEFPAADGATKELDKLIREKRKKGYADAGSAGSEDDDGGDEEDEDEKPAPKGKTAAKAPVVALAPAAAPLPTSAAAQYAKGAAGRNIATRLVLDGTHVRLDADESYDTPDAARAAYDRLREALVAEGHVEK